MSFDSLVTNTATIDTSGSTSAATDAVEAAVALVNGGNYEATGIAMAPAFRSALAQETFTDGRPRYPELAFGGQPGTFGGLMMDSNDTVSFTAGSMVNRNRAYVGNFRDYFRWGYARELSLEVIPYGNPDNDPIAGDLAGHNQVYLRGEIYIGWAILLPNAFVRIVSENPLIALTTDANITSDLLGKSASDLQSNILISGSHITGTLKSVTGYTGFSGDPAEQSGHYLALHFAVANTEDTTIKAELLGGLSGLGMQTLDPDGLFVCRISNTSQRVLVRAEKAGQEPEVRIYSLTGLTLA